MEKRKERVAVYLRAVNSYGDEEGTFGMQTDYYKDLCMRLYGVEPVFYRDMGSGLDKNRLEFLWLMQDCREGKIDRIITKSVARFQRSIVDLVGTLKELFELGVSIYFELDNIDTSRGGNEIALLMQTCFAEQESAMRSTIMKNSWAKRKAYGLTQKTKGAKND